MAEQADFVRLPIEAIADLRWALAHGLHALAEVERSRAAIDFNQRHGVATGDVHDIRPVSTFGSTDDMTRYAEALIWLCHAEPIQAR